MYISAAEAFRLILIWTASLVAVSSAAKNDTDTTKSPTQTPRRTLPTTAEIITTTRLPLPLCDSAKRKYKLKVPPGDPVEDIHTEVQPEDNTLQICRRSDNCCKAAAERRIIGESEKMRKSLTSPLDNVFKSQLLNTSRKYHHYFYKLIQNSQRDLDQLFQITYKERYRNNTMVFKKLYISLRQFMNGSELNLKTQVDEFFARLFQIVYTMSNPMYKFDDNYQTCIHDSTPTAMPFADAQPKITVQILRSFIASKVFLEGLRTAYDVSKKLLSIPRHDACKANFMRMTHCSICQNIDDAKPCKAYCSNVMKGCYVYIIMIQPKWNRLIQDMMELADKLQGPFSMEAIIGPLGVKISEAIMVFQHNKLNVTNKVQSRCGVPSQFNFANTRKRRDLAKSAAEERKKILQGLRMSSDMDSANLPWTRHGYNSGEGEKRKESEIEKLVRIGKAMLNNLTHYWIKIPKNLCEVLSSSDDDKCWNGTANARYTRHVVDELEDMMSNNPEFADNLDMPNEETLGLANELQSMSNRIQAAISGTDNAVGEPDDEDGSGGSGKPVDQEGSGAVGSGDECEDGSGDGGSGCRPTESPARTDPIDTTIRPTEEDSNTIPPVGTDPGQSCENCVEDSQYENQKSIGDKRGSASLLTLNSILILGSLFLGLLVA